MTQMHAARAFLFADLRGFTRFAESRGAASAANLIERYRAVVRAEVARSDGAEIKTEGDSFFVVFPTASSAVLCGLAIAAAADRASTADPDAPIRVGIGIHAGETIDTAEGFVGPAVNQAARICAVAEAGEVLVSDTVRALSQAVLPVVFHERGKRQLKGVPESVALFAVVPVDGGDAWTARALAADRRRGRRRRLAVGAVVVLGGIALLGIVAFVLRSAPGLPAGPWVIGLAVTLEHPVGPLVRDGVSLAIDDVNDSGGIGGEQLVLQVLDEQFDEDRAAANATTFAVDPSVLAMIGSPHSPMVRAQIPITNEAGLAQCSPTATDPALTRPEHGALALRSAFPEQINFVRTIATNAVEGPAMASFAFNDLGVSHVLVIDAIDDQNIGRRLADAFATAFEDLGGQVTQQTLNEGAEPASVLQPLDEENGPQAVYAATFDQAVAGDVRAAMAQAGHGVLSFLSWEGVVGPGDDAESFVARSGDAAAGSFATRVAIAPVKAAFADRLLASDQWTAEDVPYVAAAYACTEVILDALRSVAASGTSADRIREAVRTTVVDPDRRFETVIGSLSFDQNGDLHQQYVEIMTVDAEADGGIGGWVITKPTQDYGPLP